jgi:ataxia telangiectasia mutated family protein
MQVHENIFTESNKLIKSIQIFLNALNELRLCHVMERSSLPSKRESSKVSFLNYPFSWLCLMLLEFLVFLRF